MKRKFSVCLGAGALAAGAIALGATPISASTSTAGGTSSTDPTATGDEISLATQIDGLLSADMPQTYGGDVNSDGLVKVYVTAPAVAAAQQVLQASALQPAASAYIVIPVQHSYQQLADLTDTIDQDLSSWQAQGLDLSEFGPDPSTNKVDIGLTGITSEQVSMLTSYYGAAWVSVSADTSPMPTRYDGGTHDPNKDRFTDLAPYSSGDQIELWNNDNQSSVVSECTDAWGFTGNGSGNHFGMTAGHCEGNQVRVNQRLRVKMGDITTDYFTNTGGDSDLETFRCSCTSGRVWLNNGYWRTIVGFSSPASGDQMTVDGMATGEHTNQNVVDGDTCKEFDDGLTTCHLIKTTSQNDLDATNDGDSGGPTFQRSGSQNAYATGVIVGGTGTTTYSERISYILGQVNGSLDE
jgi:hypothetical protein